MAYRGEIDPMLVEGVRRPLRMFVFDDGWVLVGLAKVEGTRWKAGRALAFQAGAAGGAAAGVARALARARAMNEIKAAIEADADTVTAREAAGQIEDALLTPLDAVASARFEKGRLKARKLVVTADDGSEHVLKFGHKSTLLELLPPLLGSRWVDAT